MKKSLLTTALIACYLTSLFSQSCLPEGITFTTQTQIDSFQINYPGCNEILWKVIISGEDIFDLSGLSQLESVTGLLEISNTVNLTSLSGLQNLNFIDGIFYDGGILRIINNDVLINLNGLEGLTKLRTGPSTGSRLDIHNNPMLISLSGIENIESSSIEVLIIQNNPSLANCDLQNICDHLVLNPGFVPIENNATGCNSWQEVEEACNEIGLEDNIQYPKCSIYPNPAKKEIFISINSDEIIKEVNIYNQVGQRLIHENRSTNMIDVSSLKQGMYVIELVITESRIREKLIIR